MVQSRIFLPATGQNSTLECCRAEEAEKDASAERDAKFLVYWLTTTTVSTSYSYTATSSFASLTCTPSEFPFSQCGK